MRRPPLSILGIALAVLVTTIGGVAHGAGTAASRQAAGPVTVDFESGVSVGAKITNQYGAPGTPAGPTFIDPYPAGIDAGCAPPELSSSSGATSGSKAALLTGCAHGEFYATGAVIVMGYSVQDVSMQLKGAANEVFVTALRADKTVAVQQRGFLPGGGTGFGTVSVHSLTGSDIAYVVIETGSLGNGASPTGVAPAIGTQLLVLDDFRYDPPSTPPGSSFSLGASPPSQRIGAGATVTATIPITWVNNPNPSASPVQFDVSAPAGLTASISPNPTSTGQATLTVHAAASATPGPAAVVVTGYVDKGTPNEKKASVSVALLVEAPFDVQILSGPSPAPCTPGPWHVRIPLASSTTGNLTITLKATGAITLAGIDGKAITPTSSLSLSRPTSQTGVVSVDVDLATSGGTSGTFIATVSNGGTSVSKSQVVAVTTGLVTGVETTDTGKPVTAVSAPMFRRPGTMVRIVGTGFCQNAMVQFGPTGGRTPALKVVPGGHSLVVAVPRTAVTGPVIVVNSISGKDVVAPSKVSLRVDTFRSRYAYPFRNFKHQPFSTTVYEQAFGDDEIFLKVDVCAIATLGLSHCPIFTSIFDPHAALVWLLLTGSGKNGVCYGISLSEAKFASGDASPSSYPSSVSTPTTWQLTGPTAPSTPLDTRISIEHLRQASAESIDAAVAAELGAGSGSSYATWMRGLALAGLDQGKPMIVTVRDDGGGHAMLVYDLEDIAPGKYRLYLADPNVPFGLSDSDGKSDLNDTDRHAAKELMSSILVDGPADQWSYPFLQKDEDGKKLPWSDTVTGDSIQIVPLKVAYSTSSSLPTLFHLAKGLIILASNGSRLDQVTDATGKRLLDPAGDSLRRSARIPGSATVGPTEAGGASGPIAVLTRPGSYAAEATRHAGAAGQIGAVAPNGVLATAEVGASRAPGGRGALVTDRLTMSPGAAVTFQPGSSTQVSLTLSTRDRAGNVVGATVTGRASSRSKDTVAVRNGVVTLDHTGPGRAASLTLTVRAAGGLPQVATLPLGALRAGERVEVAVGKTGRLGTAVGVKRSVAGRTTVAQVALRKTKARVSLTSAKVRSGKGRITVRVGLRASRGSSSAGATILVLSGKRIVARGQTRLGARALASGRGKTSWTSTVLRPGRYRVIVVASATTGGGGATSALARAVTVRS